MPIYEYKCRSCGQVSEVLTHGSANLKQVLCLNCGSDDVQKILSVPNLVKEKTTSPGTTCCGRAERCDKPPCSSGKGCQRT